MDNRLQQRCMVAAKVSLLSGGVCRPCNEKIRAQAQGVQGGVRDRSDRELHKHGVKPEK